MSQKTRISPVILYQESSLEATVYVHFRTGGMIMARGVFWLVGNELQIAAGITDAFWMRGTKMYEG